MQNKQGNNDVYNQACLDINMGFEQKNFEGSNHRIVFCYLAVRSTIPYVFVLVYVCCSWFEVSNLE